MFFSTPNGALPGPQRAEPHPGDTTVPDFRTALKDGSIHLFDGGYGTLLMARGLPAGMSPELWGLEKPEVLRTVHADYLAAGARILTTNTFGGSAPKLGLGVDVSYNFV